uniref:RAB37, member RAS oncogene family n=1 Tax=Xiphophorus couchianus TaxID=32473 RepID=A0A3B5L8E5_9TELE
MFVLLPVATSIEHQSSAHSVLPGFRICIHIVIKNIILSLQPGPSTILVGDSGVGKTSLLVQFDQGKFIPGSFSATVGIGFTNKEVTVDNVKVKLQIWDTAGQERFRSVTHAYYRDAHALLLLYDITNKSSFDNIRAWLTEIHEYAHTDVVIMLLGNKVRRRCLRSVMEVRANRIQKAVSFSETEWKLLSLSLGVFRYVNSNKPKIRMIAYR